MPETFQAWPCSACSTAGEGVGSQLDPKQIQGPGAAQANQAFPSAGPVNWYQAEKAF